MLELSLLDRIVIYDAQGMHRANMVAQLIILFLCRTSIISILKQVNIGNIRVVFIMYFLSRRELQTTCTIFS